MNILIKSILSMSMYGSIAILAVLIFRFLFRRLPKKITVLLWLVAALRLVCPLNFKSSNTKIAQPETNATIVQILPIIDGSLSSNFLKNSFSMISRIA